MGVSDSKGDEGQLRYQSLDCAADRIKIVVGSFPAKLRRAFSLRFCLDWEKLSPARSTFPISKANKETKLHNEPGYQEGQAVEKLQKHYARPEEFLDGDWSRV